MPLPPDCERYRQLKRNAITRNINFAIERETFREWWRTTAHECEYCGLNRVSLDFSKPLNGIARDFTIDRRDITKGYTIGNICFCCWTCNRLKSNFFTYWEWREIAWKHIRPRWQAKVTNEKETA